MNSGNNSLSQVRCQADCYKRAVTLLKGVPLCLSHYCGALTEIAHVSTSVRAFHGDVVTLAKAGLGPHSRLAA